MKNVRHCHRRQSFSLVSRETRESGRTQRRETETDRPSEETLGEERTLNHPGTDKTSPPHLDPTMLVTRQEQPTRTWRGPSNPLS